MRGVFDDQEPEPAPQHGDTELTLGTGLQLAIFLGLLLICALCFGLGYAMGRHGSPPKLTASTQPAPGTQTAPQAEGSRPKPSATGQTSAAAGSSPGQPQVRPALPSASNPPQPAAVQPAISPASPLMVQIAAVTHSEDAEVLVNALRRHGYAVVARREATDSLIHVRVGPFNTRDEANKWRLKLLNDGYNAIVQP